MSPEAAFLQVIRLMDDGMDRDDALAAARVTPTEFENYLKLTGGGARVAVKRIGSQPDRAAPPTVESLAEDVAMLKRGYAQTQAQLARFAALLSQGAAELTD